ncbi:MAG TPA: 30S ribosomal protein S3 [Steroidobacteraceae bacterium]|jgi:small subunit ribosomal protein S3|nr:30S ribosomal protein S3 [Steroidobacteraceae bacterium]HXS08722.1 30S ribosomal protein S3 [Candidatus Krumholzibacteria bacterium]
MGQKTNPVGFRLGINRTWDSRWFATKEYSKWLDEDIKVRNYIKKRLFKAGVARVEIERSGGKASVNIYTARPGMVIGRKGSEVDLLRAELKARSGRDVQINIKDVKKPELNAQLVAEHIAMQLQQRVAFRRAMKKTIQSAMRMGAQGIKVQCSGRLGGSEIARREGYHEGRVPLHTLRADIDFARSTAHTTFGCVGVKVWIYKGEVFPEEFKKSLAKAGEGGR